MKVKYFFFQKFKSLFFQKNLIEFKKATSYKSKLSKWASIGFWRSIYLQIFHTVFIIQYSIPSIYLLKVNFFIKKSFHDDYATVGTNDCGGMLINHCVFMITHWLLFLLIFLSFKNLKLFINIFDKIFICSILLCFHFWFICTYVEISRFFEDQIFSQNFRTYSI